MVFAITFVKAVVEKRYQFVNDLVFAMLYYCYGAACIQTEGYKIKEK